MSFKILHHLVLKLSHSQTTLPVIIQMYKDTICTAKANKFLKAKNCDIVSTSLTLCSAGAKRQTGFKNLSEGRCSKALADSLNRGNAAFGDDHGFQTDFLFLPLRL